MNRPLTNGDATSAPFTPASPGTYRWIATYNGDANNNQAPGHCNDANETSTVSAAPPASPTSSPTATASATASATATASPTRTASPSATSSPTGVPGRLKLSVAVAPAEVRPGERSIVTVHGSPNEDIQLLAYSRPSTTYVVAREGVTDVNGDATFAVTPGTNTRLYAHYTGGAADLDSATRVIQVHTVLSLSAYRGGVRRYHFQGTNLPRGGGQLITLYRYGTGPNHDRYCVP